MIQELLRTITQTMQPHLYKISLAMVATFLIVYGSEINKFVKSHIKPFVFAVRLVLFIAVCSVGYPLVTIYGARLVRQLLMNLSDELRGIAVVAVFCCIGVLAERKKYI